MNQFNRDLPNKLFPRLSVLRAFAFCIIASLGLVLAAPTNAQTGHPASESAAQARRQAAEPLPPSERDVADTQEQMLKLLRLSPVLTTVVAHDPSLLSDQEYVSRNNPELAQFITQHPDIAKNPEFYLFSHLNNPGGGHREQVLERAVWPDLVPPDHSPSQASMVVHDLIPMIIVPALFLVVVWIARIIVESRRWSRSFRLQSEVHSRLIDKFTSTQELAAYMETEAGKRFLEASPAALGTDMGVRMPNVVARILTPLQVGIVLTLLGAGLLGLRHSSPDMEIPLAVLGMLVLMPGIGFILSAGATWVVAHRLGLMPQSTDANEAPTAGPGTQFRP